MKSVLLAVFVSICSLLTLPVNATETTQSMSDQKQQELESWQHFSILVSTIETMRNNLESLREELETITVDHERERIKKEVDLLAQDLQSLNTALEMLATGGADLSLFGVRVDKPFDLREELQSIFEPILVELRRLSERPRKIERLRSDLLYYQQRLEVAQSALQNLVEYRDSAPTPVLKTAFQRLEQRWQRRHDDLQNRVNLVQFELDKILSPENESKQNTFETLKNLFGGRLLNLAMAVGVMILTYSFLALLAKMYRRFIMRNATTRRAFVARVISLSFYLLTTLIVLLSGMTVFYVRGDWVLLGLFLIGLAGAAWAIQKSLPRFLTEAKLILNLGPVKEGERVIYNNLPWLVNSLNFQASLHNPLLQGGTLQIPVKDLVNYNSRKFEQTEPWFPSQQGDWVLLEDNTYGEVKSQTPELVEVNVLDAVKTYPVQTFLDKNPHNLSAQGFTMLLEFGLDYQHQKDFTGSMQQTLENDLMQGMKQSLCGDYIKDFSLQFSKADASSLNYVAVIRFDGKAANQYLEIPRVLQGLVLASCNQHGWVIPFNQIMVHSV